MNVLAKAGYDVIIPNGIADLCCGLIFDSRGYPNQGTSQMTTLEAELLEASDNGAIPILCDTSPCMARMKEQFKDARLKTAIFEPTEFAATKLLPRLEIYRKEPSIAVHVPCSSKQMKKDGYFETVARACSESVTMSPVPCCGAAGDRGCVIAASVPCPDAHLASVTLVVLHARVNGAKPASTASIACGCVAP